MKKGLKYISIALITLLFLLIIVFFTSAYLVQQPKVQTWLVGKATKYLTEKTKSDVDIESVDIKFFKTLSLKNVYVSDKYKDTLFFAKNVDVTLNLGKTLKSQITSIKDGKYYFKDVAIDSLLVNAYRTENDSLYNFSNIIDAFTPKEPKPKKDKKKTPIVIDLKNLQLSNVHLTMDDKYADNKFELLLSDLNVDVEKLDLANKIIYVDDVNIVKPQFYLTLYNLKEKDKNKVHKPFMPENIGLNIKVKQLTMEDGLYAMNMNGKNQKVGKLDISNMRVQQINLDATNYSWDSTGMKLNIKNLSTNLKDNIQVKHIEGNAYLDNGAIRLNDAKIALNESKVNGDFALQFKYGWDSFKNFEDAVMLSANLNNTTVYKKDITQFVPSIDKYLPEKVQTNIQAKGYLSDLKISQLQLQTGNITKIDINGTIKGLPKINQTILDLNVKQLKTSTQDLQKILPFVKLPEQVANAGNIQFSGIFKGKVDDFYTKGRLITDNLGTLDADIYMKLPKGKQPQYKGNVTAIGLNLAEITGNSKLLGTVDLNIDANGAGFDIKNLETDIKGTIRNLYLNGFVFDKIDVAGRLEKKKFTGKAFFDDDCFLIDFNGFADFNQTIPKYAFETSIKNADLHKLNLSKDTFLISLDGKIQGEGIKLDEINANGIFKNIIVQNNINMITLSDVTANIESKDKYKHYSLKSNEAVVDIKGEFDPLTIVPSAKVYLQNYSKLIKPTVKDYANNKNQDINLTAKLYSNFSEVFKVFIPKLYHVSDLDLTAQFNNQKNVLNFDVLSDSLNYDGIAFKKISSYGYNQDDELLTTLSLDNIKKDKFLFNDITVDINSSTKQLLSSIYIENDTAKNSVHLESLIDFNKDTTLIQITDSKLKLNNKIWTIQKNNFIKIMGTNFITQNFSFINDNQSISVVNGSNSLADLNVVVKNLNLSDIAQIVDTSGNFKSGELNGNINLKNILTQLEATGNLQINKFQYQDFYIDKIMADAIYGRDGKKRIELGGNVIDTNYSLALNGFISLEEKGKEYIELYTDIDRLDMSFLKLFLGKELDIEHSYVGGSVKVSGDLKNIVLEGQAKFLQDARLKLNYLGTIFNIPKNETITLNKSGFDFGQITVFDDYGNSALLQGKLLHQGFKNFEVSKANLDATTGYNFMNTTYEENQDFYGKVFAEGIVDINGPFENLFIDVTARTLPNTVFNLPVSNKAIDEGYSYIKFFDPNDTLKVIEDKIKTNGINIDMELEATPDAQVNIILNPSNNDKIVGYGSGDLTMQLKRGGELTLNGTYDISKGSYDFKFQSIISKKFIVQPGGKIIFSGNPLDAVLDLNAQYVVRNASLRNIVDSTSPIANKSVDVTLNMYITNTLQNTEINFDITQGSTGISSLSDELKQALDIINSNKNEVYNQAFGLLLFNSFLPSGLLNNSNQQFTGYTNSLTEFVSGQLSNLLTQGISKVVKGASLDVLLKDLESDSRQFGFSYKQELFNSRLIFTVGGNVNFGAATSTASINNLNAGSNSTFTSDFVLEYLVTPDGRIRLKTFAKTGDFDIVNQDRLRTGGAISFQKDFDKLKELFKTNKKKKPTDDTLTTPLP
ncbi:MAG: hypothetical protein H6553_07915 [Chitinophagales bacterium]|nr:hypothetical protein [Chitinophagales bacterium]